MAEFAPALILLLIIIFFPMLDLVCLCFDYSMVLLLNYNQAHEAALVPADQASDPNGTVQKAVVDQWQNGFGRFLKIAESPHTMVRYRDGAALKENTMDKIVNVQTTVVCEPFLSIPIPGLQVPGLNRPMALFASSERPMEDPDNAPAR